MAMWQRLRVPVELLRPRGPVRNILERTVAEAPWPRAVEGVRQVSSGAEQDAGTGDQARGQTTREHMGNTLEAANIADDVAARRRAYRLEVHRLRKQYALERDEKARTALKVRAELRKQQAVSTAEKLVERKEASRIRQLEVAAAKEELMQLKAVERAGKAEVRKEREQKLVRRTQKQQEELNKASARWIEEKDLERRIIEAMAQPHFL